MAAVYYTVNIYPYPLTNLSVKQENISRRIIDNGTYYTVEDIGDGIDFTISCDEYIDKTFSAGSYTIHVGNLYAWTCSKHSDCVWYTDTPTPTTSSLLYDTSGFAYNHGEFPSIDSATETTITISEPI